MTLKRVIVMLALLALPVIPAQGAAADEQRRPTPVPAPVPVPPEYFGMQDEVQVEGLPVAPWRMEELNDGRARLTFGNVEMVPVSPGASRYATGSGSDTISAASLSWYCNVYTLWPVYKSGNYLIGYYEIDCYNVIAHRDGRQLQRDSWSGWRSFTNFEWRAWRYTTNISSNVYGYCNPTGTYNYRLRVVSQVQLSDGTYTSPSHYSSNSRYTCGTGVS